MIFRIAPEIDPLPGGGDVNSVKFPESWANVIKNYSRNLRMFVISYNVYPRQAFPANFNVFKEGQSLPK
jgi:hypothetical protein